MSELLRDGAPAELKHLAYALLQLKVVALDLDGIQALVAEQVAAAPRLLTGAAVALELDAIADALDGTALATLLERLRFCGLRPVAVECAQDSALATLAESVGLPAVAASRRGERPSRDSDSGEYEQPARVQAAAPAPVEPAVAPQNLGTLRLEQPVRSGQQVYARAADLVLVQSVSAAAEVIADGSIHIYGRLSGKALAGALGDRSAQIYCLAFDAELVSIAGHFRVFESVPAELKGKACQLYLDGDRLEIRPL